jgi:hypothetical protein
LLRLIDGTLQERNVRQGVFTPPLVVDQIERQHAGMVG